MNYQKFLKFKKDEINSENLFLDLSKTDLYSAFPIDKSMKKVNGHVNGNIHRCHLVEDWLNFWKLPEELKRQVGVSSGVRNSLSLLSNEFSDRQWVIPKDVYPYYQYLLSKNSIQYVDYETLNDEINLFDNLPDGDILLLTYPFKPLSRNLNVDEIESIENWLNQDKSRRLVVDAVYLNVGFPEILGTLFDLFSKEQTFLLFSLSKSFLLPEVLGLTFIPEKDIHYREIFKSLKVEKHSLNLAYQALNAGFINDLPFVLNDYLKNLHNKTSNILKDFDINLPKFNGGYLYHVPGDYFERLLDHKILTIPDSVFGGHGDGIVISLL